MNWPLNLVQWKLFNFRNLCKLNYSFGQASVNKYVPVVNSMK
jgi:hypothetical protein